MNNSTTLVNKIVLLKELNSIKRHYRFSDVINHMGHYWKESTQFILTQNHLTNTILRTYIEQCPDNNFTQINPNKLTLLYNIIKSKIANGHYILPTKDELVIHLRTGDVIENKWFLQQNYIQIIQKYINTYNIKKVTFCTAFHFGNNITQQIWLYTPEKHAANVNKLNELFTKVLTQFKHIQFDVKSSKNIDEDVIYMAMSTHFVKDNGGFSKLMEDLISYKNLKSNKSN